MLMESVIYIFVVITQLHFNNVVIEYTPHLYVHIQYMSYGKET